MISGAHVILYSSDADADRRFLRDVLAFPNVDAGDGWLIFALPPAEMAVHPGTPGGAHECYLVAEDIEDVRSKLAVQGVEVTDVSDEGWGLLMHLVLPGGGRLGVYQPRHARPIAAGVSSSAL